MNTEKLWQSVLEELRYRLGDENFESWFNPLRLKCREGNNLVVEVPNSFYQEKINERYGDDIIDALEGCGAGVKSVRFIVNSDLLKKVKTKDKTNAVSSPNDSSVDSHPFLNKKYTFESFVVGPSNQFAHAACKAVSEGSAQSYNPLFIYGGVGLGKTHLLNAIGNRVLKNNKKARIICIQAESFMNDLINSIRHEKMEYFRKKYRKSCDILLMDDIEILCGKERTQEEFFYTFNGLFESGKKIVITSDRYPKDMPELEERLRSRFESGIIVDIQPPELETKLAILGKVSEEENLNISDEVAEFLASNVKTNIRKLVGSLIRLGAYASLSGKVIDLEFAKDVLKNLLDNDQRPVSASDIIKETSLYFNIRPSEIKSRRRYRKFSYPRQIAMYLCRDIVNLSYPEIGQAFGGKDHATVIHACKKVDHMIQNDSDTMKHIKSIKKSLGISTD